METAPQLSEQVDCGLGLPRESISLLLAIKMLKTSKFIAVGG